MLLSLAIALIPHQPQINPNGQQIGVDTDYYVNWINALNHASDYRDFFHQAFVVQSHGDKPLVLIFLFTITKFLNIADSHFIVEHVPLILGPLLVLVVFYLTHEMTSKNNQALLASFFTSISFQVMVGIYAGFYANWFALIIGYLSFVFLLRSLKNSRRKQNLTVFSVLIIVLLFTHIHTWSIIVAVMSVLLIVLMKEKQYSKYRISLLLVILLSSIVLDVVITSMTGSLAGIEKDIEFAKATGTGIEQFAVRWSNLTRSVYSFLGGQFSNFIILSLGLCWAFQSNTRDISSKFLMIFMSVGLIAFLVGDYRVQARIFYDIPFQISAAIALSSLWKSGRGRLITVPVCIWLVSLAIRAVSNFPLLHSA
jgi:asparagine N-glycosylation enzyme membrane subunit Stt3